MDKFSCPTLDTLKEFDIIILFCKDAIFGYICL